MATDYQILVYDTSGNLQYVVTDFLELEYIKKVNQPGLLRFVVPGGHDLVGVIDLDYLVEVYRRNDRFSLDWYVDFYGLFRAETRRTDQDGRTTVEIYCPGLLDLVDRRIIAWTSGQSNRSEFASAKAETICNTLVDYNAGASATTGNGRERTGTTTGLTVETDGAAGNTLDVTCAWKPLLATIQEVARIGGGDFDVVSTGSGAFQWRWYESQLGTDRSASVIFSLERGNMDLPVLTRNRLPERTVAVVAGQGQAADRSVEVRTGTNYDVADNNREVYVDARHIGTAAALQDRGDARLDELEMKDHLTFQVIQLPGTLYGLHYFHGDKVTGKYEGVSATKKIDTVRVAYREQEQISVELADA